MQAIHENCASCFILCHRNRNRKRFQLQLWCQEPGPESESAWVLFLEETKIKSVTPTNLKEFCFTEMFGGNGGEAHRPLDQPSSASGKHYEWQLFDGKQWTPIANDHVIETHYCQPSSRGITLHTTLGPASINFDKLTVQGVGQAVQRLSLHHQTQREDVGWYYKGEISWCEYGTQGSGQNRCSVSSQDLEQQYLRNPETAYAFRVGNMSYKLDFSAMTQTNLATHVCRQVRRRPKLNSIITLNSSSTLSLPSPLLTILNSPPPSAGYSWEFMGDDGVWTKYQKPGSTVDSAELERLYQLNPQGQTHFMAGRYTYTLHFAGMYQVNATFGTKRQVRRAINGNSPEGSASPAARWQYKDIDGLWKDYVRGRCSVSSQDVETRYNQNPCGTLQFSTGRFQYTLDFHAMTQTNLSTTTQRQVQRLLP